MPKAHGCVYEIVNGHDYRGQTTLHLQRYWIILFVIAAMIVGAVLFGPGPQWEIVPLILASVAVVILGLINLLSAWLDW
jgi:uncharacterized membrane protein